MLSTLFTAATEIIRNRFAQLPLVDSSVIIVNVPQIETVEEGVIIPSNFAQFLSEVAYREDPTFSEAVALIQDWENAVQEVETYFWNTSDYPVFSFDRDFIFDQTGS